MWNHYLVSERRLVVKRKWRRKPLLDVIIRPMEFSAFLSLGGAAQTAMTKDGEFNIEGLKLLLPLFTNGAVPADVILKLDDVTIARIWLLVNEINDLEFIKKRSEENIKENENGKPVTEGMILASIASRFPAYTIEEILHLPAQTILALSEDLKSEEPDEQGEWEDPTPDDYKKIMGAK